MQIIDEAYEWSAANPDTTTVYKSQITKYDPDANGRYRHVGAQFKNSVLDRTAKNYTIANLYAIAWGGFDKAVQVGYENFPSERTIVEAKDTFRIASPTYYMDEEKMKRRFGSLGKWVKENTYCYTLVLHTADSSLLFKTMQRDLINVFGDKGSIEKRKVCRYEISGENNIKSAGRKPSMSITPYGATVVNMSMFSIFHTLKKYINVLRYGTIKLMPFIDETNWNGNLTLNFLLLIYQILVY